LNVFVKLQREWLLLIGSLLVMAALYNHYMGHSAYLVEIIFVAVGVLLALYSLKTIGAKPQAAQEGLIVQLLTRVMSREKCAQVLPLSGFLIILLWSGWKLFEKGQTDLRMEDFIVTLFGLSLVLYYSGPSKFTMQKDFMVLYLMFMTIVFAVIWKLYTILTGDSYVRITAYSEYYFITMPVVFLVNLWGVPASYDLDLSGHGLSNIITYTYHGRTIYLGIGEGCSGLYSAGLFFSAFLAFVLVRYRKIDRYVLVALGLGFLVTWASNIIRMTITILVGSAWGHPALVFVHSYIGIIIFVVFVTVFWYFIVRWLDWMERTEQKKIVSESDGPAVQQV